MLAAGWGSQVLGAARIPALWPEPPAECLSHFWALTPSAPAWESTLLPGGPMGSAEAAQATSRCEAPPSVSHGGVPLHLHGCWDWSPFWS